MSEHHQDREFQEALRKIERQNERLEHSLERHEDHELHEVQRELRLILHELRVIARELGPKPYPRTLTKSITNRFSGDIPMANNALVFNVGQTSIDTITPLLADGVTPSAGVLSNVVVTFSDPSATFVLNPDNTVTFTGVAASTAPISGSVACTVTDTDGVVSTWNQTFTVQTNGGAPPPQSQLTQSIVNSFSVPTP